MSRFSRVVVEPKVYVNNMNSRTPAALIPESAPSAEFSENRRPTRRGTRPGTTFLDNSNYSKSHNAGYSSGTGSGVEYYSYSGENRDAAAYDFANNANRLKEEEEAASKIVLSNGDELHANLQGAYNRIMRRLQRELNYEKFNQVPLATEFEINIAEQEEEERRHNGRNQDNNPVGKDVSMASLDSRGTSISESKSIPPTLRSVNPGSVPSSSTPRLSLHSPLPLLADQGRRHEGKRNMTSFRVEPCKRDEVEDVEYSLAQQPCPETLRLVIQHLTQTVVKKMELSMRSSLRDVFRFSFDCKTLFDRLLKDIPSYSAFQGNAELLSGSKRKSGHSRHSTAMQMHELYQELRKAPVVLPRAEYARDSATGSVIAVLKDGSGGGTTTSSSTAVDESSTGNSSGFGGNSVHHAPSSSRPQRESSSVKEIGGTTERKIRNSSLHSTLSQTQALPSSLVSSSADPGSLEAGCSSFPPENRNDELLGMGSRGPRADLELPPGYGKSARLVGVTAEDSKSAGKGVSGYYGESIPRSFESESSFMPRGIGMQEKAFMEAGSYHAADNTAGNPGNKGEGIASPQVSMQCTAAPGKNTGLGMLQGILRHAPQRRKDYSETNRQAYEVMMTSVGTLTEEYSGNIVTKEEYDKLFQNVQQLEVQIAEAKNETNSALEQLLKEKNHTQVRARIIQYLRETIFRECNVLRSRLALAEQKEHYHHYQQQQQQAATTPSSARGGSLIHAPLLPSSSFASTTQQNSSSLNGRVGGAISDHATSSSYRRKVSINPKTSMANLHASRMGGGHPDMRGGGNGVGGEGLPHDSFALPTCEIGKVQSLLDLALLAVETESVLTEDQWKLGRERNATHFRNPKREIEELNAVHEERQRILKERIVAMKTNYNRTIVEKDQEISRLKRMNDLQFVQTTMLTSVQELKQSLLRMKNNVSDLLVGFRIMLFGSLHTLANKATLMDKEVDNYFSVKSAYSGLLDLVKAAHSLFMPMLTTEYAHGYHPWPTKIRNTIDPLGHVLQTHSGPYDVLRLREPLSYFSELYIAIHKFVTSMLVVPESSRPSWGKQLSQICSAMVLSPLATIDLIYTIRIRYDKEVQLRKTIARLNFQILWKAHLQRVLTERCVSALVEGEMDPHTTMMPIARSVNRLAEDRAHKARERSSLQKERMDNAKELYAFWRDRQIDIYEGDAVPKTQNRVAILSSVQGYGIGPVSAAPLPMHAMKGGRRASLPGRTISLPF